MSSELTGKREAEELPNSITPVTVEPLTSTLDRMIDRPFGLDDDNQPIRSGSGSGSGKLVVAAITFLQECVGRRAERDTQADESPSRREARISRAKVEAVDRLIDMINAAIPDRRYQVSREYLLNESNYYYYEFLLFVSDYCRVISGNPKFLFNQGARSIITPAVIYLARPLGVQRTYSVLPRLTAKFVKTDLRVTQTTPGSAIIQWCGAGQIAHLPPQYREAFIRASCQQYQIKARALTGSSPSKENLPAWSARG